MNRWFVIVSLCVCVASGLTMAAGTAGGGWKIIKTLGMKLAHLKPVHGFAAALSPLVVPGAALGKESEKKNATAEEAAMAEVDPDSLITLSTPV